MVSWWLADHAKFCPGSRLSHGYQTPATTQLETQSAQEPQSSTHLETVRPGSYWPLRGAAWPWGSVAFSWGRYGRARLMSALLARLMSALLGVQFMPNEIQA